LFQGLFITYNNLPTTAVLFWPLAALPYDAAKWVFTLLNNALYLLGLALLLRALKARPLAVLWCASVCLLMLFYPLRQSFGLGQMNGLLVFLLAGALIAAMQRRDTLAGGLIVLAAALKISPLVLVIFFIAQRRYRAVVSAIVAGLAIVAVTLLATGSSTMLRFVTEILPVVGRGSAALPNQSVLGAIYRLSVPAVDWSAATAAADLPAARLVWMAIAAGVLIVTGMWVARARLTARPHIAVALSNLLVAGLLVSSLTWDHYLLWLSVAVCAVSVDWFSAPWLRPVQFWPMMLGGLILICLPIPIQANVAVVVSPIGSSLSTLGLALLWLLIGWRLNRLRASRSEAR
jgi:alpha-1,2-mannosyltransferase